MRKRDFGVGCANVHCLQASPFVSMSTKTAFGAGKYIYYTIEGSLMGIDAFKRISVDTCELVRCVCVILGPVFVFSLRLHTQHQTARQRICVYIYTIYIYGYLGVVNGQSGYVWSSELLGGTVERRQTASKPPPVMVSQLCVKHTSVHSHTHSIRTLISHPYSCHTKKGQIDFPCDFAYK